MDDQLHNSSGDTNQDQTVPDEQQLQRYEQPQPVADMPPMDMIAYHRYLVHYDLIGMDHLHTCTTQLGDMLVGELTLLIPNEHGLRDQVITEYQGRNALRHRAQCHALADQWMCLIRRHQQLNCQLQQATNNTSAARDTLSANLVDLECRHQMLSASHNAILERVRLVQQQNTQLAEEAANLKEQLKGLAESAEYHNKLSINARAELGMKERELALKGVELKEKVKEMKEREKKEQEQREKLQKDLDRANKFMKRQSEQADEVYERLERMQKELSKQGMSYALLEHATCCENERVRRYHISLIGALDSMTFREARRYGIKSQAVMMDEARSEAKNEADPKKRMALERRLYVDKAVDAATELKMRRDCKWPPASADNSISSLDTPVGAPDNNRLLWAPRKRPQLNPRRRLFASDAADGANGCSNVRLGESPSKKAQLEADGPASPDTDPASECATNEAGEDKENGPSCSHAAGSGGKKVLSEQNEGSAEKMVTLVLVKKETQGTD